MRHQLMLCAAALFPPALSVAQEAPTPAGPKTLAEFTEQYNRLGREYRFARAKDKNAPKPDYAGLGRRALDVAAGLDGDGRAELLCWAAIHAQDADLTRQALAAVRERHLKSAAVVELMESAMSLSRAIGAKESADFLAEAIAESPHALVRAWGLYWQSVMLRRGAGVTDEQRARADELLATAAKLAEGSVLADRIAGPRFIAEHLQIGMVAPDIVGEDVDGVAFKLSDYRGKVVVLDFWGFW